MMALNKRTSTVATYIKAGTKTASPGPIFQTINEGPKMIPFAHVKTNLDPLIFNPLIF